MFMNCLNQSFDHFAHEKPGRRICEVIDSLHDSCLWNEHKNVNISSNINKTDIWTAISIWRNAAARQNTPKWCYLTVEEKLKNDKVLFKFLF